MPVALSYLVCRAERASATLLDSAARFADAWEATAESAAEARAPRQAMRRGVNCIVRIDSHEGSEMDVKAGETGSRTWDAWEAFSREYDERLRECLRKDR